MAAASSHRVGPGRRRRLRTTFEGKWFIILTLGVGIAAINTGNNLLYIALGMNLSLVLISGILSEWCLRRVAVSIGGASEAFARREALLSVTCSVRRGRFPAYALRIVVPVGDENPCARFPAVAAGTAAARVVRFRPDRRGILAPSSCVVSTRFPFGLFEKSAAPRVRGGILVYPEPAEPGRFASGEREPDPSDGAAAAGRQGAFIRGTRELLPTDPARDVHWKASARLGKWMAKEREGEGAPVVDVRVPSGTPARERERAISFACARVLRCERAGRPYRLWIGRSLRVDANDAGRRGKALSALALLPSGGAEGPGPEP